MKRAELERLSLELHSRLITFRQTESEAIKIAEGNERVLGNIETAIYGLERALKEVDKILLCMQSFKKDFLKAVGECGYEEDAYTGDVKADYEFVEYLLEQHNHSGDENIDKEDSPNFDNEVEVLETFLIEWKVFAENIKIEHCGSLDGTQCSMVRREVSS